MGGHVGIRCCPLEVILGWGAMHKDPYTENYHLENVFTPDETWRGQGPVVRSPAGQINMFETRHQFSLHHFVIHLRLLHQTRTQANNIGIFSVEFPKKNWAMFRWFYSSLVGLAGWSLHEFHTRHNQIISTLGMQLYRCMPASLSMENAFREALLYKTRRLGL